MTPQPQIVTAPDSVALAQNVTSLQFAQRHGYVHGSPAHSKAAADGTTAGAGVSTFLELLTIGTPTRAVPTKAERL